MPVTKEAIFFDRTHLVLSRAAEVGEVLGLNKEKRLIDLVIGVDEQLQVEGHDVQHVPGQRRRGSTSMTGNELVDWTERRRGRAAVRRHSRSRTRASRCWCAATTVLVMPAYRHAAHRVFNAAEIDVHRGRRRPRPRSPPIRWASYRVLDSRLAYRRIVASGVAAADAKKWWFIGDFRRAFAYMENWPITVTQSPLGSEADFNNDIVLRFKASERGAAAVLNPRYVVKSTG